MPTMRIPRRAGESKSACSKRVVAVIERVEAFLGDVAASETADQLRRLVAHDLVHDSSIDAESLSDNRLRAELARVAKLAGVDEQLQEEFAGVRGDVADESQDLTEAFADMRRKPTRESAIGAFADVLAAIEASDKDDDGPADDDRADVDAAFSRLKRMARPAADEGDEDEDE